MLPLSDYVRDRIKPPVWRTPALPSRGQRGGLVLPLPQELRGRIGTPLGMTSALLREMAHPTQKKKRRTRRLQKKSRLPPSGFQSPPSTTMTALALHKASASAVNDSLQLFDLPPTDTSMTAARMLELTPISQGINPMEFVVPGVDAFIDLSHSYFTMKLRLRKQNGTDLADGELLYPANNLAHTLINQLTCHLNGTLISPQNDSYAYKAYLETVLNYSEKEGHTLLRPQGWFPTQHEMMTTGLDFPTPLTANNLDSATPHAHYAALSRTNKAVVLLSKQEQVPYQGGTVRTLVFKLHSELFQLNKPLVPRVEIKLRFTFNSPDFFLNGKGVAFKTLDTSRHSRREVAKYSTVRSEIRVFSHAANQMEFNEGNLYQGRVPDRIVVGLLHTLSYHGDVAYPPFSFQKFGLSQIEQLVRGEVYPAGALELNHNNTHKDLEGYFLFLMASEAWRKGQASMVEPEMWGGAGCCTLFMFDNVPNGAADSTLMNPRQDGDLRIRFKLGATVNRVINVLLYAEFENVLEIDGNGAVIYNI